MPPHLRRPELCVGKLLAAFRRGPVEGDPLPWAKTHGEIRLRPGEASLWPEDWVHFQ